MRFILFITALTVQALAGQSGSKEAAIQGVVYGRETSPSGSGVETVYLRTVSSVLEFRYQKPLKSKFANPSCEDIGAVWVARVRFDGREGGHLISASCNGRSDHIVRTGVDQIRRWLRAITHREYTTAYELLTPDVRRTYSYDTIVDYVGNITLDPAQAAAVDKPFLWCLSVRNTPTPTSIDLAITIDCYPRYKNRIFQELLFRLTRASASSEWHVAALSPSPDE